MADLQRRKRAVLNLIVEMAADSSIEAGEFADVLAELRDDIEERLDALESELERQAKRNG
jgi:hypothetical protein